MKKKALLLTFVLLAIPILTILPVQAKKTIDVYYRTPGVDPPTTAPVDEIPGDVNKFSGNNLTLIRSGTFRTHAYGSLLDNRGPLGNGTLYTETIISISHSNDEYVMTPLGLMPTLIWGHGIYRDKLVIESGPYGAGTLSGIVRLEWEWDFTGPPPTWRYEGWGSGSYKQGTGDFAGVKVYVETYFKMGLGNYQTKTTVVSPS